MKKRLKGWHWVLITLLILLLTPFLILWLNSGNRPEGATRIAVKGWVEIGGVRQGYFIRGELSDNPVILFLHGGPGSPELPMLPDAELEKSFTVCYWDQRGAGMSYHSSIDPATMTVDQMVEDTRQITDSLCHWYGVDKIYLMGHSWGSYLGVKTIEKYPDRYLAYFGIGQVTRQRESERLAYDYLMAEALKCEDQTTVQALRKFDPTAEEFPSDRYMITLRTNTMNKYGVGVTHQPITMAQIARMILLYKGYTLIDKFHYLQGMSFSQEHLFSEVLQDDLFETSVHFKVPVYILHGKYDYQVSYQLAKSYFDSITAPQKEFFTFEQSAHSPILEEAQRFAEIVRSIDRTLRRPTPSDSAQ